jgi:Ca-activated chloride channel homolog
MYFANPWGLLGLLSLPIITAIHLFQRRFPPLLVAGAHLWGAETRVQTAGRRRDRLPITASLLLELAAGLIFSLALAQPRFGEMGSVAHLVVVLDNSASMSGTPADEPGFRETAVATIGERMDELGRDARVTLIRSGILPTLLGQQAMPWDQARSALSEWQPQAPRHDFSSAWDEAARIVGEDGKFLFVTDLIDERSSTLPMGMEIVSVGRRLPNVAISTARWTFDSETGQGTLFVRISNYGSAPVTATLTGTASEQTILEQQIPLDADSAAPLEVGIPGGIGQLTLNVSAPGDGLAVDNTVTLVEPKVRLLSVAVTLPDDSAEQRLVRRALSAMSDVQLGPPEQAHLLIGPAGDLPEPRGELWWLGIGPINPSPIVRRQARDLLGPYLVEKQHPLLDGIVLGGVVWGGVQPTDLPLRPLISAGRTVLLGQLIETAMPAWLMNVDLARSNLGESPDWPILMTNLIERRRDELPGLRLWNFHVGETIAFRAPPTEANATRTDALTLVHASGSERTLVRDRSDHVEITRLERTGVYEVLDREDVIGRFAVNFFDADESRSLAALAPGRRQARAETIATRLSIDDAYSWLMVLAILLLLAAILTDWYVLRPRGGRD